MNCIIYACVVLDLLYIYILYFAWADQRVQRYFTVKGIVQEELKEIDYLGLTTNMWTSRANDGYITLTSLPVLK